MLTTIRRVLIGHALPSERIPHERLGNSKVLAVLSSDALSSVAYATEEILLVLVLPGGAALILSWPIALAYACAPPHSNCTCGRYSPRSAQGRAICQDTGQRPARGDC